MGGPPVVQGGSQLNTSDMSATNSPTSNQPRLPRRRQLIWVSVVLCGFSWLLQATQPEVLAWLMIFPRWTWLLGGMVLLAGGFVKSRWKWSLAVALLWALFTGFNVEESRSLLRSIIARPRPVQPGQDRIRVITFNCGSDATAAAQEAFRLDSDLIFFQESPQRGVLVELAGRQWGAEAGVAWGPDATIVARGRLTLRQRSTKGTWVWATWHRDQGDIEVVSLRLSPVPLRFDCWSRDCWHAMTQLRETHRTEIAELLTALGTLSADRRCIIGGDFNSPAHDASLNQLALTHRDAFDEAGVGWGNTIVNGFPVQRIDQVWINRHFSALRVQAFHSLHSDHALVAGDLVIH